MIQQVAENGVVGAGGAGFPTATKLKAHATHYLINAAECEPLLHKDKELLLHRADALFAGLEIAMRCVGAEQAVLGIKNKYTGVIDALTPRLPARVRIQPLRDVYPAGDEFLLVYEVLGKVIPPGGLPLDVGAIVSNVETLVNIGLGRPVTRKFLTVAGAVRNPVTLEVAIGTPLRALLEAAGGATTSAFAAILNGVMMGSLITDLEEPVTKTTGGLIILPSEHPLLERYRRSERAVARIGRSACDQCSFCTELCPRYLLGHPIEPHKSMRALGFTMGTGAHVAGSLYCCECNLCSLYSCPEGLDPRDVCRSQKPLARERGLQWRGTAESIHPHPIFAGRQTPTRRLMQRLGITHFVNRGPLQAAPLIPSAVRIPLLQHIGAPAQPIIADGATVSAGQCIAAPPADALGAPIHASISGLARIAADHIEITQ
jgi:Na+-translocating ferredoxin:NAD+ oxidoreductase RnfC subunit